MQKKLSRYWHIFWTFRKLQFMRLTQNRANFYFWSSIASMWTIFNIFFFALIAGVNNGIGGWTLSQMYVLLAIFTLMDSFTWSWFYQNMKKYTRDVFMGDMSFYLVKPIDTQFLVMTQENDYEEVFRFGIGVAVLIWAIGQAHISLTLFTVLGFLFFFFCAAILLYHLWFIIATFSFWVERLDNINDIIPSIRRIWQLPRSVYSGLTSTVLTVVVPLALITSLPSEALLGKFAWLVLSYFVIFTLVVIFFTRWFFHFSLRRYGSVGS